MLLQALVSLCRAYNEGAVAFCRFSRDDVATAHTLDDLTGERGISGAGDPTTTTLLRRTRVHLVPSLNPDGHAVGSVTNAQGYDLNRNFHDRFDRAEQPGWPVRVGDPARGETNEVVPDYHTLRPEPEVCVGLWNRSRVNSGQCFDGGFSIGER